MTGKSDSELAADRLAAENAVLLLEVVDSTLRRIDPPTSDEPDRRHPVQMAGAYVRLAMGSLAAALTGGDTTPSGLFDYISRVFGAQSVACRKHEDEDKGKSNGDLPDVSVN